VAKNRSLAGITALWSVTDVEPVLAYNQGPTGTPLVIVRELALVPETGYTTFVRSVAVVIFIRVHREVIVDAIVQLQNCFTIAKNHVTVIGHQCLLVEAQVSLVHLHAMN